MDGPAAVTRSGLTEQQDDRHGDGVEANEFDFHDGVIYFAEDGVAIRHWRRYHTKDGASAYRLDFGAFVRAVRAINHIG